MSEEITSLLNAWYDQAKDKLDKGLTEKLDRYGEVMKQAVHDALLDFCRQDGEFAQAVVQGGSFADCMKAVAKGVKGSGISDMTAYGLAVQFFFPGAGIDVRMTIDLCASVRDKADAETQDNILIDLNSFFKV